MKRKYYDLQPLLDCKCKWMILYGMRSNGKSYAVKKYCLEDAYKNGIGFVYLRRWSEDIKTKEVSSYFEDAPVKTITGGEWESVSAFQGFFYWMRDEDGKQIRSTKPIGRYCSLNQAERYKSQVFSAGNIIFEEFLTSRLYLGGAPGSGKLSEPDILMQFVSTVARDRDINIFMIANTVTRVNPYLSWGLKGMMQQKPGTIDIYHMRGENGVVDIAVENCEVVETKSKMFFGLPSKQIISGEWEVNDVPKLLKPYQYYDMLYELKVRFSEFNYIMQLLFDGSTGGSCVYIYPDTKDRRVDRIITDEFSLNPMVNNGLRAENKAEALMMRLFKDGKVCYSDNLTGTDFQQVIKNYNFRGVTA